MAVVFSIINSKFRRKTACAELLMDRGLSEPALSGFRFPETLSDALRTRHAPLPCAPRLSRSLDGNIQRRTARSRSCQNLALSSKLDGNTTPDPTRPPLARAPADCRNPLHRNRSSKLRKTLTIPHIPLNNRAQRTSSFLQTSEHGYVRQSSGICCRSRLSEEPGRSKPP